jgi:hypothetical protein
VCRVLAYLAIRWFEIFESARRLMLSGVLVICYPGSIDQIFIGMFISLVAIKVTDSQTPTVPSWSLHEPDMMMMLKKTL